EEAIENIDIGGPALLRAAAKNHAGVGVVVDPADYARVLEEMRSSGGISEATRFALAQKVFAHTAAYDGAIANYLSSLDAGRRRREYPDVLSLQFARLQDLRYGENPHQSAALYRDERPVAGSLATCRQLQGKELSYNNIADADAAWECVKSFAEPACVIVKHANPCGVATGASLAAAYEKAFKTDPGSAFGGILAFNRALDRAAAEAASQQFAEVIVAPRVEPEAQEVFAKKANVRVLEVPLSHDVQAHDYKRVGGGLLVQTTDAKTVKRDELKVVTKKQPTEPQWSDLLFAWRVQKVYVAPGNAGTALEPGLENVALSALADLVSFARKESVQLTVVGPEAPLAAGVVDAFGSAGLRIFGPTRAAAQLESSKDFA